jgi:hypothetical protein
MMRLLFWLRSEFSLQQNFDSLLLLLQVLWAAWLKGRALWISARNSPKLNKLHKYHHRPCHLQMAPVSTPLLLVVPAALTVLQHRNQNHLTALENRMVRQNRNRLCHPTLSMARRLHARALLLDSQR